MSTNTNPDAASASSTRDNPCYGIDPNVASLNVYANDEHSYLLPYAQLLYAETIPNPALEKNADAPPEKLVICFAAAEVTVLCANGMRSVLTELHPQLERTTGQRVAMSFGVSVIHRGPCGWARTASSLPAWHQSAIVETCTLSSLAAVCVE